MIEIFNPSISLIDVRAPIEFAQGHLPGAVNLPLLEDPERALVGTTYKQQGNAAAVELGYQIVSGTVKSHRIQAWLNFLSQNPNSMIYCYRGGLRSKISQEWISQAGFNCPRIEGGYKKARSFLMGQIEKFSLEQDVQLVSGPTGSGKTQLLHEIAKERPIVDLENLAHHKGSAFGGSPGTQPTQTNFENALAVKLLMIVGKSPSSIPLVEDESRMIGQRTIPELFFNRMRKSKVIWIDEPLEQRISNIYQDYILSTALGTKTLESGLSVFTSFKNSVSAISKKLGGLRTQEIMKDLLNAEDEFIKNRETESNKIWIEKLLTFYYDPLYLKSIERRKIEILFRGTRSRCRDYLMSDRRST